MMNYKVFQRDDIFDVFETQTEQIIKSFNNTYDAKELARILNLGGGFDGFTPRFVLNIFGNNNDKIRS